MVGIVNFIFILVFELQSSTCLQGKDVHVATCCTCKKKTKLALFQARAAGFSGLYIFFTFSLVF